MKLEPLQDYIVVELLPVEIPSSTLIVIQAAPRAQKAKILSTGPDVRDIKPGEEVWISRLAGQEVGDKIILHEGSVLAWV